MALAVSYSQFVPGKTGMRNVGLAVLTAGAAVLRAEYSKAGISA